jgi:PQQ-dependent dehydrogenase (s-GDH family)
MRRRTAVFATALTLPLVAGPTALAGTQPPSSHQSLARDSAAAPAADGDFTRRVLTTGLSDPFEIVTAGDGRIWVTERTAGRVTQVDRATGAQHTVLTVPDVVATPGEQDGLLGMALGGTLPGGGPRQVYLSFTYDGDPDPGVLDRRQRIVRYRYHATSRTLRRPRVLLEGLLASDDHNAGRLVLHDGLLHYTIGDRGNNQDRNACRLNEALRLPTRRELRTEDWVAYQGKTLRMRTDGSIPAGNPVLAGVRSHVWTFGHRNHQGLAVGPRGRLYSSEQGPKSDDELNRLVPGGNYGWPRIAGYQDDSAYVYGNWSERASGCDPADYEVFSIPDDVPQLPESSYHDPRLVPPLRTFFTVRPDYDFLANSEKCLPLRFICHPTVAPSNLDFYTSTGIPGWSRSFLATTLKTGTLFRMPATTPTTVDGPQRLFRSVNRYRDTAVSPNGRVVYLATDSAGIATGLDGLATRVLEDPGAILAFRYTG